jgi:hypothetical protein
VSRITTPPGCAPAQSKYTPRATSARPDRPSPPSSRRCSARAIRVPARSAAGSRSDVQPRATHYPCYAGWADGLPAAHQTLNRSTGAADTYVVIRLKPLAVAALAIGALAGCGSTSKPATTSTTPAQTKAPPAVRWTVEGVHRAHRLGGRQLPTRARHTFLVVKLRADVARSTTLDPVEWVRLIDGRTEYTYSQRGFAALNASGTEHLFFGDALRAGRAVHGAAVFDAPLRGRLVLEFDTGQRIPVTTA